MTTCLDHHHHYHKGEHDHDHIKLKLHYFDTRGRAELIRFILSFANIPFEDIRYTKEQWPEVRNNFPAKQVPALEIERSCGKKILITQSLTIARYLAQRYDLIGDNCIEKAQCEEVVDCLNDLINLVVLAFLEQDPNRKEIIKNRLKDSEYPRIFGYLEERLIANGGSHIVGDRWTYADLAIGCFIGSLHYRGADIDRIQRQFPTICELWRSVEAIPEIKDWIDKRPDTEL